MMEAVRKALQNAKNAVILPHCRPDGDAIGSMLAMGALLEAFGIPYSICLEEEIPSYLAFLGGAANLYREDMTAPHTAIAVDCGDKGRLTTRLPLFENAAVRIGDINLVRPDAAATAEIMADLFEAAGVRPSEKAATNMLAGILTDTGGFRFSNTSPKTHRIAAFLMECGADNAFLSRQLFEKNSIKKLQLEAAVIRDVTLTHGGKTAIGVITKSLLDSLDATGEDAEGISSLLRGIEGVETAAVLREAEDGIRLSLRTEESVDAASICQSLGGGGHARAAGATIEGHTMDVWKDRIIKMIGEAYGRHC